MKKAVGILLSFVGIFLVSPVIVSASEIEMLPESEDYEKIVALSDEIVSYTNHGPVYDPGSESVSASDIDFSNALKEYIDTPLLTSELLSVSEVDAALEQSDYIWIIPIKAYGHLYEACAVRANGEDGQPMDDTWHISGVRGYENDDTLTYTEQLKASLSANPDIAWEEYRFRLVGGVEPIRFPVWIASSETEVEYLIPGREDAAACLTDSSEIAEYKANDDNAVPTAFSAYRYPAVVAAVADQAYVETEDAEGGSNTVLNVAAQPAKYQRKMLYSALTVCGCVFAAAVAIVLLIRKKRK